MTRLKFMVIVFITGMLITAYLIEIYPASSSRSTRFESGALQPPRHPVTITKTAEMKCRSNNSLNPDATSSSSGAPRCNAGKVVRMMKNRFGKRFNANLEPFLTNSAVYSSKMLKYSSPFGLKGSEALARSLLEKLPEVGLPDVINKMSCRRCAVVGNGGLLNGSHAGSIIDGHDVVIRLNMAPVEGYEIDVGTKTTFRLLYPESSSAVKYNPGWLLVVVAFKRADLLWVDRVVDGKTTSGIQGFWQKAAKVVTKSKKEIRLFNPHIFSELATDLIGFDVEHGKIKNTPTTGAIAIAMALHMCDDVSVAGFGYNKLKPNDPAHYYPDREKMDTIRRSQVHNIKLERQFLGKLIEMGVIQDLTHGL